MRKAVNKLKIKTITYARLKNKGNFENDRVEATVEIGPKDCPVEKYKQLKKWVDQKLCDCYMECSCD